jgi:hypothetical protein
MLHTGNVCACQELTIVTIRQTRHVVYVDITDFRVHVLYMMIHILCMYYI